MLSPPCMDLSCGSEEHVASVLTKWLSAARKPLEDLGREPVPEFIHDKIGERNGRKLNVMRIAARKPAHPRKLKADKSAFMSLAGLRNTSIFRDGVELRDN